MMKRKLRCTSTSVGLKPALRIAPWGQSSRWWPSLQRQWWKCCYWVFWRGLGNLQRAIADLPIVVPVKRVERFPGNENGINSDQNVRVKIPVATMFLWVELVASSNHPEMLGQVTKGLKREVLLLVQRKLPVRIFSMCTKKTCKKKGSNRSVSFFPSVQMSQWKGWTRFSSFKSGLEESPVSKANPTSCNGRWKFNSYILWIWMVTVKG